MSWKAFLIIIIVIITVIIIINMINHLPAASVHSTAQCKAEG